ncbi:MAG: Endonuclease NucS [Candidatus Heimdallarchaeota archaeon LC_3]|nr:MAG: Endonuclease NucS [Candidatus Heimdallarchaeota archaeon LC_3]
MDSRTHHGGNSKPRLANSDIDLFFRIDKGKYELYDYNKHGNWEIAELDGKLITRIQDESSQDSEDKDVNFVDEKQLEFFIVQNLSSLEEGLELYVDENENSGVQYRTEVGPIDILAVKNSEYIVIELKVKRTSDHVVGQIQRYMAWVKRHLANGKSVRGIIVTLSANNKLQYSVSENPNIELKEYQLKISFSSVSL